jgi:hypothetical protein
MARAASRPGTIKRAMAVGVPTRPTRVWASRGRRWRPGCPWPARTHRRDLRRWLGPCRPGGRCGRDTQSAGGPGPARRMPACQTRVAALMRLERTVGGSRRQSGRNIRAKRTEAHRCRRSQRVCRSALLPGDPLRGPSLIYLPGRALRLVAGSASDVDTTWRSWFLAVSSRCSSARSEGRVFGVEAG